MVSYGKGGKFDYLKVIEITTPEEALDLKGSEIYIDKEESEKIDPQVVKNNYILAYKKMIECENEMKKLLKEGGYIDE